MFCQEPLEQPIEEGGWGVSPCFRTGVILLLILLLGASLRLYKLDQISPPGLNQDEAANAWSAYCILKTGKDYAGVSWPIFYTRNVGANVSTLYVYLLIPFQVIGGLNVYTTRLPAALAAVFNIWVIYFVGKRLFNTQIGIAAAALLAIDPWDIQHSRWGHEASIVPFLSLAPLALMLWANMPVSNSKTISPRPFAAALAGALTGICCYSYYTVRLFVPVLLFLTVLFTLSNWRQGIKTPKGLLAIAAFFIAFAAFYGPLIWLHIFHPEGISRHFLFSPNRINNVPLPDAVKNVAIRYIQHFGPYFLFIEGDSHPVLSPPGIGQFYWYMLPLMLAGLISIIRRFKSSPSARVILAFVVAYPAGDCVVWGSGLSILRSAPGLCGLLLLAAVGAVEAFRWMRLKSRKAASTITTFFAVVVIASNIWYFHYFFGEFSRKLSVYTFFQTDLVEACKWLKPRLNDFDAIFFTTESFNMPHVTTAVALGYDPEKWFNEPRDFTTVGEYDYYTRYGKMYFMYGQPIEPILKSLPPNPRILVIVRPEEELEGNPNIVHTIYAPEGIPTLLILKR